MSGRIGFSLPRLTTMAYRPDRRIIALSAPGQAVPAFTLYRGAVPRSGHVAAGGRLAVGALLLTLDSGGRTELHESGARTLEGLVHVFDELHRACRCAAAGVLLQDLAQRHQLVCTEVCRHATQRMSNVNENRAVFIGRRAPQDLESLWNVLEKLVDQVAMSGFVSGPIQSSQTLQHRHIDRARNLRWCRISHDPRSNGWM